MKERLNKLRVWLLKRLGGVPKEELDAAINKCITLQIALRERSLHARFY